MNEPELPLAHRTLLRYIRWIDRVQGMPWYKRIPLALLSMVADVAIGWVFQSLLGLKRTLKANGRLMFTRSGSRFWDIEQLHEPRPGVDGEPVGINDTDGDA